MGRILGGEVERLGEKIARPITLENGVEKVGGRAAVELDLNRTVWEKE